MACDIVTTVGSASADGYADISDADSYHAAHTALDTWDAYSDEDQCRALKMATRLLDYWYDWNGVAVNSTQALLWPRTGTYGPNGYLEPSDAIPTRIVHATCELARQLLAAATDRTADSELETSGVKSLQAGSVALEFRSVSAKVIPDAVAVMVSPYGTPRSRTGSASHVILRG